MVRYLTEFLGTMLLVLAITLAVSQHLPMAPLAIGVTLTSLVYVGGPISGAHYNPAITLALWIRGRITVSQIAPYVLSQIAGATAGSYLGFRINGVAVAVEPGLGVGMLSALFIEGFFTFVLALVVLHVATSERTKGNRYYGLAIGGTVVVAAFVGGAISGGAYNPAVGTGPAIVKALVGGGSLSSLWLYWVGPVAGGVLGAVVFRIQDSTPA